MPAGGTRGPTRRPELRRATCLLGLLSISPAVCGHHPGEQRLPSASSLIWRSRLQPPRSLLIYAHDDTASLLGGGAQYRPSLGAVGVVAATGPHLFPEVQNSPPRGLPFSVFPLFPQRFRGELFLGAAYISWCDLSVLLLFFESSSPCLINVLSHILSVKITSMKPIVFFFFFLNLVVLVLCCSMQDLVL